MPTSPDPTHVLPTLDGTKALKQRIVDALMADAALEEPNRLFVKVLQPHGRPGEWRLPAAGSEGLPDLSNALIIGRDAHVELDYTKLLSLSFEDDMLHYPLPSNFEGEIEVSFVGLVTEGVVYVTPEGGERIECEVGVAFDSSGMFGTQVFDYTAKAVVSSEVGARLVGTNDRGRFREIFGPNLRRVLAPVAREARRLVMEELFKPNGPGCRLRRAAESAGGAGQLPGECPLCDEEGDEEGDGAAPPPPCCGGESVLRRDADGNGYYGCEQNRCESLDVPRTMTERVQPNGRSLGEEVVSVLDESIGYTRGGCNPRDFLDADGGLPTPELVALHQHVDELLRKCTRSGALTPCCAFTAWSTIAGGDPYAFLHAWIDGRRKASGPMIILTCRPSAASPVRLAPPLLPNTHPPTHPRTHARTHARTRAHTHAHAHAHARTRTHTHAHALMHAHAHTHARTRSPTSVPNLPPPSPRTSEHEASKCQGDRQSNEADGDPDDEKALGATFTGEEVQKSFGSLHKLVRGEGGCADNGDAVRKAVKVSYTFVMEAPHRARPSPLTSSRTRPLTSS